jgi:hypothetical protein
MPVVAESTVAGLNLPALPKDKKRKIICFSGKFSTIRHNTIHDQSSTHP